MATAALDDARLNRLGWWRRLVALPPEQVDRLLAAAVGTLILVAIAFTHDPGTRRPDVLAYLLGVAGAALLLFRRRWPLVIVPATLLPVIIYHDRNYPGPGPVIAFGVALYSFAVSGWRLRSLLAGVVVIATLLFNRAVAGRSQLLSSTTALYAAVTVAVLLLGDTVRSRRALRAEIEERIRRVAAEREAEALRRMTEERLRIARELHDVMAHTIAVIAVQAGVAADMLDTRPEQAKSALELIRQASRDARRELQATLDVLRQEGDTQAPLTPTPGLNQLAMLIEQARGAGLDVRIEITGGERPLPAAVDLAAYRIVQEALTNVLRHAHARHACIRLAYNEGGVEVEVSDDGRGLGTGPRSEGGRGLRGMAERAAAVGGSVEAGPAADGGFRVLARLPLGEATA